MTIALMLTAFQITAAPPADEAAGAATDAIVVTATRSATSADKVGSSVTILDREEIERSQETAVSDLLAQVPGVTFSRNGSLGGQTSVRIRGAEADQTVLLIDGIKLNDPSSPGGGFNFANLLTRSIDRIEVLRGPQSTLWGSQAIGGVVNIITTAPGADRVSVTAQSGARGTVQVSGEASGRSGRLGFSVAGGYFGTDGVSAFAEELGGREEDGYRNLGASGRLTYRISDDVEIDLRGWASRGRTDFDVPPRDTADYGKTRELIGYAGLHAQAFGGRLRNRFSASLTRTSRDNYNRDLPIAQTFDAEGRNERFDYQGEASLGSGFSAVFGAEREIQKLRSASPTAANPKPEPLSAQARLNSVYGQLQAEPVTGLALTFGARQDDHNRFGGATTGRITAAYSPDEGRTVARASYGTGFKAPTPFQLLSQFGNPDLEPERGRGWDAGLERRFGRDLLTLGATYFGRRSSNLIDFTSCFGSDDPRCATRPIGFYDNIQATEVEGVELTAFMQPLPGLIVRGNYTWMDARNRSRNSRNFGNVLPRRPEHAGFAEIVYDWRGGLQTSVALTRSGASFDDAANRNRLDDYTLVDLRFRYAVEPRMTLFGRLENLFDERHETTRRYGSTGRGAFIGATVAF